ncbi:odorant receptor 13a-like isoform X2 [Colletes latitarsis]|uniref:odorant receptor 13a-like isoform X2 n=1 Tax=Colletes latitarsis TaxID=2605962 RepID=UPI0040360C9A
MRRFRIQIPNQRDSKFDMSLSYSKDFSIVISSFFMKCVGIWSATNRVEQRVRNITLIYTVFTILFSVWIQTRDLYFSWGDFGTCTYIACNILCLNMGLFKIFILFLHKTKFLDLVTYMRTNFWQSNYVPEEQMIFTSWTRICTYFICFFTFFTEASIICYVIRPVVANIGRNESDRILPFNMWLDLPLSLTPYFEVTFILQVLSLYHVGICYICTDNFLCIMNLHVAGQFRILQYRLECIQKSKCKSGERDENSKACSSYSDKKCYTTFKNCIQQHQALIAYCDKLEEVFKVIVLAQVAIFSVLICFVGYQVALADLSSTRRITFVNLLTSSMCQLFMFTYSCDCLIRESTNVATAIYAIPWMDLRVEKYGKLLRKDMQLAIMRTNRPCCLTANGFFPILSTAMSYFTLLKQSTDEATSTKSV